MASAPAPVLPAPSRDAKCRHTGNIVTSYHNLDPFALMDGTFIRNSRMNVSSIRLTPRLRVRQMVLLL
jgi:hypothetical protein